MNISDPLVQELAERIVALKLAGKDTLKLQEELAQLLGKNVEKK